MAFLPAIASFVATVGYSAAAVVGAAGAISLGAAYAIGGVLIAGGAFLASRAFQAFDIELPQADSDASRTYTTKGTVQPVKIVYGEALVSGPIVYVGVAGNQNQDLYHAIALTGHVSEEVKSIFFDDIEITTAQRDSNGAVTSGTYGPVDDVENVASTTLCAIRTHDGTYGSGGENENRDGLLASAFSSDWTSNHLGQKITYMVTKFTLPDSEKAGEIWDKYTPTNIKAIVKGVNTIYDPRGATSTGWSDNPALCLANYLTDTEYGVGIPTSKIDWDSVEVAADACDELVDVPTGATQKAFTCNGVLFATDAHKTNITKLLSAMNGNLTYSNGKYYVHAGFWVDADESLDENDLRGPISIKTSVDREARFNTIKPLYMSPADNYKMMELPPVTITGVVSRDDDRVLEKQVQLPMTNNSYMAQRIAHQLVNRSSDQRVLTFPANLKGLRIKVGDRVNVSIAEFGYSLKTFQCIGWSFSDGESGGVDLTLIEDTEGRYDHPAESFYSTKTNDGTINEGFPGVSPVTSLTATGAEKRITVTWKNPSPRTSWSRIFVYAGPNSTFSNHDKVFQVSTDTITEELASGTTRYYWARAVKYGDGSDSGYSTLVGPVSATASTITADAVEWTDVDNRNIGIGQDGDNLTLTGVDTDSSTATGQAIAQSGIEQDIVITQGGMTIDGGGAIRSDGRTNVDFSSGDAGFFLGYDSTAYKFGVGNSSENMVWDGSNLDITGGITATSGTFAGSVNVNSSGKMYGGTMSSFNSGAGFFLGYDTDAYKLSVGNSSGKVLTWDGEKLNVQASQVSFTTGGAPDYDSNSRFPTSIQSSVLNLGSNTAYVFFDNQYDQDLTLFASFYAGPLSSGTVSGQTNARNAVMSALSIQIQYAANSGGSPGTWTNFGSAALSSAKFTSTQLNSNYYVKDTDLGGGNYRAELATASEAAADFTGLGYSEFAYGITDEDYYMTEQVTVYGFPKGEYFFRVVVTVTDGSYTPYPSTGSPSVTNNRRLSIPNAITYTDSDHGLSAVAVGQKDTVFKGHVADKNYGYFESGYLTLRARENAPTANGFAGLTIAGRGASSDPSSIQPLGYIAFYNDVDDLPGGGAGTFGNYDYIIGVPAEGDEFNIGTRAGGGNEITITQDNVNIIGTLQINGTNVNAGAVTGPAGSDGQIQYNNGGALGGNSNLTFNDTTNTLSVTNLTVTGTTTTIDTTNLNVSDKNITLNYGSGDTSATADGAGITIQDAVNSTTDATILWDGTNDEFDFSHAIHSAGTVTGSLIKSDSWIYLNSGGATVAAQETGIRFDYGGSAVFYMYKDNANDGALKIQSAGVAGEGDSAPRVWFNRTARETYFGGQIGLNQYASKATLDIKQAGNNWEDGILIQHDNANTGWNIHADQTNSALFFGYNSDTSVALTSQAATKALTLNSDLSATFAGTISSGALTVTGGASFTDDVVINNGSPELYFGTTGNHYNWRIAAQELVDAGFEISVGSQDSNYADDTYATVFHIKNTGDATFAGSVSATEFDLPSGGILDWANGDARIVEGLVNNYSLSFQTYDGSNVTTALRLDGDNSATFAGSITLGQSEPINFGTSNWQIYANGNDLNLTSSDDINYFAGWQRFFYNYPSDNPDAGNVEYARIGSSSGNWLTGNLELKSSGDFTARNSTFSGTTTYTGGNTVGGIFMNYTSNGSASYRGYFDWRTLQLGNNGANNILAGNSSTGGYFNFWVNATSISQSGGTSGTQALTLASDGSATFFYDVTAPNFEFSSTSGKIHFGGSGDTGDYLFLGDVAGGTNALDFVQDSVSKFAIDGDTGDAYVKGRLRTADEGIYGKMSTNWHSDNAMRGGNFSSDIANDTTVLKLFPASYLDESSNARAAGDYNAGIGFSHLDPDYSTWGASYSGMHAWIGLKLHDTAGQERDFLVFATNNATSAGSMPTERMVISPEGYVGIGQSDPAHALDVSGSFRISASGNLINSTYGTSTALQINGGTTTADNPVLQLVRGAGSHKGSGLYIYSANYTDGNDSNAAHISLNAYNYGGSTATYLKAYDSTSTKFLMRGDGRLGILTDSPTAELDVRGNVRIGDGSSSEQDIYFVAGSGSWQVGTNNAGNGTSNNQFFIYDDAYRFTVQKGTGKIGIGTYEPAGNVDIVSGSTPIWMQFKETSTAYHRMGIEKDGSTLRFGEFNNDGTAFTDILGIEGNGDYVEVFNRLAVNQSNDYTASLTNVKESGLAVQSSGYTSQTISHVQHEGNWADGHTGSDTRFGLMWHYGASVRAGIDYDHRGIEKFDFYSSYGDIRFRTPATVNGNLSPINTESSMPARLTIGVGGQITVRDDLQVGGGGLFNNNVKIDYTGNGNNGSDACFYIIHNAADWKIKTEGRVGSTYYDYGIYQIGTGSYAYYQQNATNGVKVRFDWSGNAIFAGNVTAYGSPSDIRLKENIETIPNALEKVQRLRGVTFNYKKDGSRSTGLIAQELIEVLPEAVYEPEDIDPDDEKFYAVRYGNTVGLLVEAIKELKQENDELKEMLKSIMEKLNGN